MCGIAGVVSASPLGANEISIVQAMLDALVHRGPDDDGLYVDRNVAFGIRRLSIIDLESGKQPMQTRDGEVALVCNGEIYNHLELREELGEDGIDFNTKSDIEPILHLYQKYQEKMLDKLRGMFAFSLHDKKNKVLIIARDRIGEKPLYYFQEDGGKIWFSSELKSLLKAQNDKRSLQLSLRSIYYFLVYQYIPEPETPFVEIKKVPAAHLLRIPLEGDQRLNIRMEKYWDASSVKCKLSEQKNILRNVLEETAEMIIRSDVSVGVSLSGGIDSSVVAALCAKHYPGQLQGFSVGYPGHPDTDERKQAEAFAHKNNIPFHDIEISVGEVVGTFPDLVYWMDDPVGDIAAYGYYAISRLAKQKGVKVLLSGIGGDELFWGYPWVRQCVKETINKRNNINIKQILTSWFNKKNKNRAIFYDSIGATINAGKIVDSLYKDVNFDEHHCSKGSWKSLFEQGEWNDIPFWLYKVLTDTWLTSNCLVLGDRLSMANSVELRLPFTDHKLIETVMSLRKSGVEDWNRSEKSLLIDSVRDLISPEILQRPKRGFTPPSEQWMRGIVSTYGNLVCDGVLQNSLSGAASLSMILNEETTPRNFRYRVVLLEIWLRMYREQQTIDDIKMAGKTFY